VDTSSTKPKFLADWLAKSPFSVDSPRYIRQLKLSTKTPTYFSVYETDIELGGEMHSLGEAIIIWLTQQVGLQTCALASVELRFLGTKSSYCSARYKLQLGTHRFVLRDKRLGKEHNVEFKYERVPVNKSSSHDKRITIEEVDLMFDPPVSEEQLLAIYDDAVLLANGSPGPFLSISMYSSETEWNSVLKEPKRDLKNVFIDLQLKAQILDTITHFLKDKDYYMEHNMPYKHCFLLEGPPGTGKTTFAKAVAAYFDYGLCRLTFSREIDDKELMQAVAHIPARSWLWIEDIDALFRGREADTRNSNLSFSGLLNSLDMLGRMDPLIIFITTNFKDRLDPALLRPGRIDTVVHFDTMKQPEIAEMFARFRPGEDSAPFLKAVDATCYQYTASEMQTYFVAKRYAKDIHKDKELAYLRAMKRDHQPSSGVKEDISHIYQ